MATTQPFFLILRKIMQQTYYFLSYQQRWIFYVSLFQAQHDANFAHIHHHFQLLPPFHDFFVSLFLESWIQQQNLTPLNQIGHLRLLKF